ncbi:hypothetical protein PR048_006682 [Dryococelus australis]|uniref:Secreted protein n=1 Tax=Dryococelus australis TaxID=614101 RepID=A0ABQ9IBL9_9NEOP|nr:hypothetical protein PR048_006682 [Dryococelus australis]
MLMCHGVFLAIFYLWCSYGVSSNCSYIYEKGPLECSKACSSVTRTYRMVSNQALQVLSCAIPIDLLTKKRGIVSERGLGRKVSVLGKRQIRQATLDQWQWYGEERLAYVWDVPGCGLTNDQKSTSVAVSLDAIEVVVVEDVEVPGITLEDAPPQEEGASA